MMSLLLSVLLSCQGTHEGTACCSNFSLFPLEGRGPRNSSFTQVPFQLYVQKQCSVSSHIHRCFLHSFLHDQEKSRTSSSSCYCNFKRLSFPTTVLQFSSVKRCVSPKSLLRKTMVMFPVCVTHTLSCLLTSLLLQTHDLLHYFQVPFPSHLLNYWSFSHHY